MIVLQMMNIWTLFKKEEQVEDMDYPLKGRTSRRYRPSLKRRSKSNIWTILGKEEQVEDMNPPRTKGEQIDNMDPPEKWGVMMRLTSMMG